MLHLTKELKKFYLQRSPFRFSKIDCGKAPEALSQSLYGCMDVSGTAEYELSN